MAASVGVDREFKGSKRVKAEEPMSGLTGVNRSGEFAVVPRSAEMALNLRCGTAGVNEFPATI